jgi:hypothetical protein
MDDQGLKTLKMFEISPHSKQMVQYNQLGIESQIE